MEGGDLTYTLCTPATASRKSCPALAQPWAHTSLQLQASWFSLFLEDNLFPSKQRSFVLLLQGQRETTGGWGGCTQGVGVRGSVGGTGWEARPCIKESTPPGQGRRQNRLDTATSLGSTNPAPSHYPGHWIWVERKGVGEDPRASLPQRWGAGGVAHQAGAEATFSGRESQRVPRETGGSVLQTAANKRQATRLARGAGLPGATASPLLDPEGSSQAPKAAPQEGWVGGGEGVACKSFSLHPTRNAHWGERVPWS